MKIFEHYQMILDFSADILLLLAAIITLIATIGILRLPNFYTRLHAAGINDSWAIILAIIAIAIKSMNIIIALKLLLIMAIILFTNPSSTHCLIKSGYISGQRHE